MPVQLWLLAAAAAAALIAFAWYARREERVRGRVVAGILRAAALFLLFAGLALPAISRGEAGEDGPTVLLDLSNSMTLPASPTTTRLDSARTLLAEMRGSVVIGFGTEARILQDAAIDTATASGGASRLLPALEAARRLGADSVVVLTDGEWDDRRAASEAAQLSGMNVQEVRVARGSDRLGLGALNAPARVRSGDSARITIELLSGAVTGRDSVMLELLEDGRRIAEVRTGVPAAGRSARLSLGFLPAAPGGNAQWRQYEVRLEAGADPLGVADRKRTWIEVTREATGVVLIDLDPGWESRFLIPILRRSATGGAVGYVRLAPERFVAMGPEPTAVPASTVARDAQAAELLVLVGDDGETSQALRSAARNHPRVLALPSTVGSVAGTRVELARAAPGDWYIDQSIAASPVSLLLAGLDVEHVPPLPVVFEVEGSYGWAPLLARRDRQGTARPVIVGGIEGERRWAAASARGYWRWAFRGGAAAQLHERLFTGIAGWLLENRAVREVQLGRDPVAADEPVELLIASGSSGVTVAISDSTGAAVWTDTVADEVSVLGPALDPGSYHLEAVGSRGGQAFRVQRPFEVQPGGRELVPREGAAPLAVSAERRSRTDPAVPARRPLWPFAVAALLLCAEWGWRRMIGLR